MDQLASNETNNHPEEEFYFNTLIQKWKNNIFHSFRFWKQILLIGILFALLGLAYAYIRNTTYSADMTFIVEESKGATGGSIASALAGSVGIDFGGLTGMTGSMLGGDNVLQLLKSHDLIKSTLLSPGLDSNASIADRYAEVYKWKDRWAKNPEIGNIKFGVGQKVFTRLQDSLLQSIIKRLEQSELSIAKPDKKLGFFQLQVTTRDEILSKLICERLLKIATDFYVDTKTRRQVNNVTRLQKLADSLRLLLDRKSYSAAEANQLLLDANPAYSAPTVDAEIISRNKYIQGTTYAEIMKSLELSKMSLIQETPTVQIVDHPDFPLKKNKTFWYIAMLEGLFAGIILSVFYFSAIYSGKEI